tara:strand:- start:637 stop:798 length:162 start_codon:yes stop_codon:yes gene_type:complete
MKDILSIIRNWKIEAFSPYNDGWTQNGYRKNLIKLRDYLNDIENLKLHGEENA